MTVFLARGEGEELVYVPGSTVVVQYGEMSTASTVQFRMVSKMARLKNGEAGARLGPSSFIDANVEGDLAPGVYEVHHLKYLRKLLNNETADVVFFVAVFGDDDYAKMSLGLKDQRIAYVQRNDDISISDYRAFFRLSALQEALVTAHLRFWNVYRQCCGPQQSLENRLRLHKCPPLKEWYDPSDPHCDIYNLTLIEDLTVFSWDADETNTNEQPFQDPLQKIENDKRLNSKDDTGVLGRCHREQQKIIDGHDFGNTLFTTCSDLVHKWADPNEAQAYDCRNKYDTCNDNKDEVRTIIYDFSQRT